MMPIYGFLQGDTIGLLIFAYPNETMQDLIDKVQKAAAIRVEPKTGMKLVYKDKAIDVNLTVSAMGMQPLEHFFVLQGDTI
jgi:hypothetical protein